MASLTQWTWVWVSSGSWWWTGRPGVLQFMESQRVRHDWATELNWTLYLLRLECRKKNILPVYLKILFYYRAMMLNSPISIVQFSRYLKGIIPIFASLLNLTHFDYYLPMMYCAQSCPTLCDPIGCSLPGPSVHGYSPGKNTGVGCHFLLQGIFQIQGLNPDLPHCKWILYHLSHHGNPTSYL